MTTDIRDNSTGEPEQRRFSHVSNVTGYMVRVVDVVQGHFGERLRGAKVLDMPAGNGWVTTTLRSLGANMTPADINREKSDYVYADMENPLPFENESFDCVLCIEGIEHVLSPTALYRELARVLKPGGLLVISTPNIQNFFSRMQFASVGYFYQFHPSAIMQRPPGVDEEPFDRGHVSPMSYLQLRYLAEEFGLRTLSPTGDKLKRIGNLPFYVPFILLGLWWGWRDYMRGGRNANQKEILKHLFSLRVLFARSLIFVAQKALVR